MRTENIIIEQLNDLYKKRGYVSEEEIYELCDEYSLSFIMTDHVVNKLIDMGVLISDAPAASDNNEYYDYSQTDYEKVYQFFEELYPDMHPTLEYIRSVPPIQKGEIRILIQQIRSGNEYAKTKLTEKCLRTALRITMSYEGKTSVPLEDIFMASIDGIIEAINSFDLYSNSYFTSYLSLWIKQKIDRYISDYENIIRIPYHMYEQTKQVKDIYNECTLDSEKLIVDEISDKMNISHEKTYSLLEIIKMNDILSLDEFSENEGLLLYAKDDFEQIEYRLMSERFDKMLNKLSHRELTVIKLRYGFIDGKTYTLEEIGKQLGVTRERIRQMEKKALKKLKHSVTHYFRDIKLYYNL